LVGYVCVGSAKASSALGGRSTSLVSSDII
jgi:hypothetical protein